MKKALGAVGGMTLAGVASAAPIVTTAIVADIAANQVALSLLGVAVLTCVYALRAFSWGRKI